MVRRFSVNFALFSIVIDGFWVAMSLFIATTTRPSLSHLSFVEFIPYPYSIPGSIFLIFPVAWILIYLIFSVYDNRKNFNFLDEVKSVTIGSIFSGVFLAGLLYLTFRDVSRFLYITFWVITFFGHMLWRYILHRISNEKFKNPDKKRKVLIIGTDENAHEFANQIRKTPNINLRLVGFLQEHNDNNILTQDIIGTIDQAVEIVNQFNIDDVVIASNRCRAETFDNLIANLHQLPIKVWVIPDYYQLALHKAVVEEFAGIPLLDLRAPAISDFQRMVKRAFDLILTILLFPFFVVFFILISFSIWIESRESVLFSQERVGENGKLFKILKFRTMITNAEEYRIEVEKTDPQGNILHKSPNDPRVTKVGRILRRTSLDELPNIINVIKGEMSLVGPRPELPYLVERYNIWQRKRFTVPQGITGWWQVNGRSNKPMHLHPEDDLYYVQNYSIWLDIRILLMTIWVVIRGNGAF